MKKRLLPFGLLPLAVILILWIYPVIPDHPVANQMLAIALLMAGWWITEALPLAATSLLPVALFPLFGVMDAKDTASAYFNDVIFLFMGGFLVALAMERWNLHRRIALHILKRTGTGPGKILLGFMLSSAFLSMWISNTATAMMMLPIALSVIHQLEALSGKALKGYSTGLLLGIAYGASVGGVATLVGTPPNLSLARIHHIYFPESQQLSFSSWMMVGFPYAVILLAFIWSYLYFRFKPGKGEWADIDRFTFHEQLKEMGKTKAEEKTVLWVFILLALLWITRADLSAGAFIFRGWAGWLPHGDMIQDGTVAVCMAIVLFIFPSKSQKGSRILDWETASRIPWHILLLFGGGFALASGFKESGLSVWFGEQLQWVSGMHLFLVILAISLIISFLTELTSNTATTEMVLPILAGISISTGIPPLWLMIPATLSASMAFMLPVATPPNAIVFSTSRIRTSEMAGTGLVLNLFAAVITALMMYFWGRVVFV